MREPFAAWIERDVVRVAGPDTVAYLQGQLSQDVESIAPGGSAWSLVLEPTGKVDSWLRLTRTGDDEFVLDVDGGWGAALVDRLTRFKLRTRCDLEPVTGWRCLAVRHTSIDGDATRPIVWPGTTGVDLLGPDVQVPAGLATADVEVYERARIEAGVPALGRELTDATIPVEAGQWLVAASVSFTKGCYTGQELVARIDSRGGNAPRPVRGLRIDGPAVVGDAVLVAGAAAGALTSVARGDDESTLALAPLARAVTVGTEVAVGDRRGVVVELPMA